MHPSATTDIPNSGWQQELARAYTRVADLLADLALPALAESLPEDILLRFPLRVPRGFAARMRRGDPADPLLAQVLPRSAEALPAPGFVADPVGDLASLRAPGLLQKYQGRALLIATGACAVHCRYCFRRNFPYAEQALGGARLDAAIAAVASDPSLEEIILSGGDPLCLTDHRLVQLLQRLDRLPGLRRLRLHTRVPVVLPERVNPPLLAALAGLRKPVAVVLHCNHANEIDGAVAAAAAALREAGASLLNQAVLLRGVNDTVAAQAALAERLFDAGVLPYYLHQLDPVAGAAHFAVADADAVGLMAGLRQRLPGYLVPRLVREVAGDPAKRPLF